LTPESPKRKLAAIMFTDMVGYTALMQEDEDKARELIQRHRDLMKPIIEKYNGEILQYVGDGTFCSFESAIESAKCAIEIQKELKSDKEISLRIGIHVGDVVIDGDEVYGDGVNVASRLEPLSAPGGVNISGRVYDDLKNHKDISVESLGEIELKNVKDPMSVYALSGKDLVVSQLPDSAYGAVTQEVFTKPASKKLMPWALGAVVLLIFFFAKGWFSGESSITEVTADENSLAVLVIDNSSDPEDPQGLTQMISVRRSGNTIRITAQLINARTDQHLWAETYDRSLDDIFKIQSDVALKIATALSASLTAQEEKRINEKPTESIEAYELYLKGKYRYEQRETNEDLKIARRLLQRAVQIDSNFVDPRVVLGRSYQEVGEYEYAMDFFREALAVAERIGSQSGVASVLLNIGEVHWKRSEYAEAVDYYNRSLDISLELNDRKLESETLNNIGVIYALRGDLDNALDYFGHSLEIKREVKDRRGEANGLNNIGVMHQWRGEYDSALVYLNRSLPLFNILNDHHGEASNLESIGRVYLSLGIFDIALEYFGKSLAIHQNKDDSRGEAVNMKNLGLVHYERGEFDRSLEFYKKLLSADLNIGFLEGLGKSGLGKIDVGRENYGTSIKHFTEAVEIFDSLGSKKELIEPLSFLALSYVKEGDKEIALTYVQKLEEKMNLITPESIEPISLWNASQIYAELGVPEKEMEYLEKAFERVMQIADKIKNDEFRKSFLTNIKVNSKIISEWEMKSK